MTDMLRGIRDSPMSITHKAIALIVVSLSDPKTGVIPEQYQPTIVELAEMASVDRTTLLKWLPDIEATGWIVRVKTGKTHRFTTPSRIPEVSLTATDARCPSRAVRSTLGALGNHRRWHVTAGKVDEKCPHCADEASETAPSSVANSDRCGRRSVANSDRQVSLTATDAADEVSLIATESVAISDRQVSLIATHTIYTGLYGPTGQLHSPADASESSLLPTANAPSKNKKTITDKEDPSFGEFWTIYRKKVDRAKAFAAWRKALKITDSDTIIAAVRSQRAAWDESGVDPQFIPHPTSWLNGRRWEDDPAVYTRRSRASPADGRTVSTAEALKGWI